MRVRTWLLAAGAIYALALAATAPATLLDARLDAASAGRLRLADAAGTVWAGQGRAELRDADGHRQWSGPVAWRLRPAALVAARIEYALTIETGKPAAALGFSWSRVELAGVDLQLPAAALGAGMPALAPLGLGGELHLVVERLVFLPGYTQGSATLRWHAAASALAPVSPLGDYEFRLDGQGPELRASLRTLAGPLDLVGHGRWTRGERPDFAAIATLPPPQRPALAPFLRLFAVERGDGRFEWQLQ